MPYGHHTHRHAPPASIQPRCLNRDGNCCTTGISFSLGTQLYSSCYTPAIRPHKRYCIPRRKLKQRSSPPPHTGAYRIAAIIRTQPAASRRNYSDVSCASRACLEGWKAFSVEPWSLQVLMSEYWFTNRETNQGACYGLRSHKLMERLRGGFSLSLPHGTRDHEGPLGTLLRGTATSHPSGYSRTGEGGGRVQ